MCDQPTSEGQQRKRVGSDDVAIRPATAEDMAAVADMIQELADFEKMPNGPKISAEDLRRDGFSSQPLFRCLVAADAPQTATDGPLLGYALYFPTYSTWEGRVLMLEDLYVRPSHRNRGIGSKLFEAVVQEARAGRCARLELHVLQWNPARDWYQRRGVIDLTAREQWAYYRLTL